ncbi:MAG: PAS domain S-box protein, partial [Crocinitomicaceae bacterium]|nr:PAS domain S-box protein [Crocinitomicaceae bacterium]
MNTFDSNPINDNENMFRGLLMEAADAFVLIDQTQSILLWNRAAEKLWGYSEQEVLGNNIDQFVPGESQKSYDGDIENNKQPGQNKINEKGREVSVETKTGKRVPISISTTKYQNTGTTYFMVTCKDLTQEKIEAEKYKNLVESASDLIYTCSSDGIFTYVNPMVPHLTGYSPEELIGSHFSILIREDHQEEAQELYSEQLNSITASSYYEFPMITKSGQEVWLGQHINLHKIQNNDVEFLAIARNINERKIAQKELIRSEEKYKDIIENMKLGLLEVDNNDIITNAYPRFCEITGYSRKELVGKKAVETLLSKDFVANMEKQNEDRKSGEQGVYETQILRKDGSLTWVLISGAPKYDIKGEVDGSIGIHLDITDRKEIEIELRRAKEIAEQSVLSRELFMANM